MQSVREQLKSWGWAGNLLIGIGSVLTTNWVVAMSTLGGLAVLTWTGVLDFVQEPAVHWAAGTFLVILWTFIGVTILRDRRKPRIIKAHEDYSYGLLFEGLVPHYQPDDEKTTLGFGVALRNFLPYPIKYSVEDFDVRIGNRALPRLEKGILGAVITRGAGRVSRHKSFSKKDIKDFIGQEAKGTVDILINYGHPKREPKRSLKLRLDIYLKIPEAGPLGFGDNILEEKDEPYKG